MGLLDWLIGSEEEEDDVPDIAEEFTVSANRDGWLDIEYGGELYHAQRAQSPDGSYTAAYRDGVQSDPPKPGRVFLVESEELSFTTAIDRPNACAVANNGRVAVVDWGLDWGQDLPGKLHTFAADGSRILDEEIEANAETVTITPDGAYAATGTLDPDRSIYIFDLEAGKLVLKHKVPDGPVRSLSFVDEDDWLVRFDAPGIEPTLLTLEGEERTP